MLNLVHQLQNKYPHVKSVQSDTFYWSPSEKIIYYSQLNSDEDNWSILHEYGHALLDHKDFKSDFDLLQLEMLAWDKAVRISTEYAIEIDDDHIQNCLDTYRNWLYMRSTCPTCSSTSLQLDSRSYSCLNCNEMWTVTKSRKNRCYRKRSKTTKYK